MDVDLGGASNTATYPAVLSTEAGSRLDSARRSSTVLKAKLNITIEIALARRVAFDHSLFICAWRATVPHLAISAFIRVANSSGVLATDSKPKSARRCFTSDDAAMRAI